jgi:lysozyme family protein
MPDYPPEFMAAVNDLIDNWEGGYVDDPQDPGGETKYGISKRAYPHEDIKDLSRDRAVEIYYHDYWLTPGIYRIDLQTAGRDLPALKAKVFNMGVLMGAQSAKNLLVGCDTLEEYKQACAMHFKAIVIKHPVCAKFLAGWERRALA